MKEHSDPNVVMILIGNKCDLAEEREVRHEEALKFSEKNSNYLGGILTSFVAV